MFLKKTPQNFVMTLDEQSVVKVVVAVVDITMEVLVWSQDGRVSQ